jgi:hypothetical protein
MKKFLLFVTDYWSLGDFGTKSNSPARLGVGTFSEHDNMYDVRFEGETKPADDYQNCYNADDVVILFEITEEEDCKQPSEIFKTHALDILKRMADDGDVLFAFGESDLSSVWACQPIK